MVAVDHSEGVGREDRHLVVGQVHDPVGSSGQRRGVAGHEVLPLAHADDQRTTQPRGDHHVRIVAEQDRQSVSPLQLRQRRLDRYDQRQEIRLGHADQGGLPPEATVDQMGDHFAVGRGLENVPFACQPLFERLEVLDHPVVHHRHRTVASEMRMGVRLAGFPVGGPARVPNPGSPRCGCLTQQGFEPVDSPCVLHGDQSARRADRRHPSAVIAAVFKAPQPGDKEVGRLVRADVSDDSAHT